MGGTAGRRADLVNLGGGQRLGQSRARQTVRAIVGNAGAGDRGLGGAHHLVALIVRAGRKPVPGDLGEAGVQHMRRNARETLRMGAEGGEFEGGRAGGDHLGDVARAVVGMHRAVEREVDARLLTRLARLGRQTLAGADQNAVVIRHVDDGRHAAGCRRARRPDEILLAALRTGMNLCVDGARHDIGVAEILARARGRRRALADTLDEPAANCHIAVLADALGVHHASGDNQIVVAH